MFACAGALLMNIGMGTGKCMHYYLYIEICVYIDTRLIQEVHVRSEATYPCMENVRCMLPLFYNGAAVLGR